MQIRVSLTLGGVTDVEVEERRAVPFSSQRRWPDSAPSPSPIRRPLETVVGEIRVVRRSAPARFAKRSIDLIGSALGLAVLMPLFLGIALLVRLTSKGPALFTQTRCGLAGRGFKFYKFRTMVVDAEERKAELAHLNEMQGPVFKIRRDPRITRLGAILRRTSLDELPQLWNVLIGTMSLVGPRPPLPDEVERYTSREAQRLSVLPGITGLWQVSGRSTLLNFERWIDLDLEYARTWSMWLDLKILLKTLVVVVVARGAQ